MKLIVLAAALAVSGTAYAQTAPAPTTQSEGVQTVDDPKGGYAPTAPLFSAPPQPGQQVIFQPNPQTPTQAFPPPPPQPSYPICKKGQYDNCRQRGG